MNTSDCAAVSTACSPLTARLSITMSLYGRRPSVVRSFVIWNSLITTLSSETNSLPIENLSFSRGFQTACRKRRSALCNSSSGIARPTQSAPERPPGLREVPSARLGARQYDRDIISPASGVGGLHQHRPGRGQAVVGSQQLFDLLVGEHIGQA